MIYHVYFNTLEVTEYVKLKKMGFVPTQIKFVFDTKNVTLTVDF